MAMARGGIVGSLVVCIICVALLVLIRTVWFDSSSVFEKVLRENASSADSSIKHKAVNNENTKASTRERNGPERNSCTMGRRAIEWTRARRKRKPDFETCRQRVLNGDNVLLEQLLDFAEKWDQTHQDGYFCDIIREEKLYDFLQKWPEIDHASARGDAFDLEMYRFNREPKVFYFANGKSFCNLLNYDKFVTYVHYRMIVIGPFGDKWNFGPFSGGIHSPYFKFQPLHHVMHLMCPDVKWFDVLRILEHNNFVAWISFQQNMEHPKLVSLPIGASNLFIQFALASESLMTSLNTLKTYLIGITFTSSYADRPQWLAALNETVTLLEGKVTYSTINPFHDKSFSLEEAWRRALETPRSSKIIPSPGGLGGDTKRPVEAIFVGSVPMLLISTGMYKTYRNLPVLWVFSYDEYYALEHRLINLLCTNQTFRFEKLVYGGWREFIAGLKSGNMTMEDW